MRYYFILLFTILSHSVYSQPRSGEVIYEIKTIDFELSKPSVHDDLLNSVIQRAREQKFKLQFTATGSKFARVESMNSEGDLDKNITKLASIRFSSDNTHYVNKITNQRLSLRSDGIVVEMDNTPLKWDITTEHKLIGEYMCYKASVQIKYLARDGKYKTSLITAWFAPSLPFSYGPKEFDGLPGLILELTEKETTYLATSIKLDTDATREIDYPKGKTITSEKLLETVLSNSPR